MSWSLQLSIILAGALTFQLGAFFERRKKTRADKWQYTWKCNNCEFSVSINGNSEKIVLQVASSHRQTCHGDTKKE